MLLITLASGLALLAFVLVIALLFLGAENAMFRITGYESAVMEPFLRLITGRCGCGTCPPVCLYASCLCLLAIFLFIPMGALPQFISTDADVVIVVFLLLAAQSLYIRGMKNFSGELYQSLDRSEITLLFKFTVAMATFGCSLSWYVMKRGLPGNIFSFETYAAIPLWQVAGAAGRLGLLLFFLLFAVTSPCRRVKSMEIKSNVPLPEVFDAIRSMICPAIIAAIFMPWRIGLLLGLSGFSMFAADFALFWFKVFIVQLLIVPVLRSMYIKMRRQLPPRFKLAIVIILGLAGSLLMLADLYL